MTGDQVEAVWDQTIRVLRQPPPPVVDGQVDAFPTLELTLPAAGGQDSLFGDEPATPDA